MLDRLRNMNPQLRLFLLGTALMGVAGGIFETTFNNFLEYAFKLGADARGFIEFPRELPGFLTALFAGLLFFLPETKIATAAAVAVGAGLAGLAVWGAEWVPMLCFMTIWSAGAHLLMPVRASVGMALAHERQKGRRLGQLQATGFAASIIGCAVVWLGMEHLAAGYAAVYAVGAAAALAAALAYTRMNLPEAHLKRPKFIWKRRYWLFYTLSLLFGARKQIFITFGPWVLVKIFNQPPWIFAKLWLVSAALGIFFQPFLGRMIDRLGERVVLTVDSFCIMAVCLGYGFADRIGNHDYALWLLYACFVGDQLLFGVNMARTTYLAKIVEDSADISPSLSLDVTINHAVSMSIPALGGLLWIKYGHPYVFLAAAGVAVLMFIFTTFIRVDKRAA